MCVCVLCINILCMCVHTCTVCMCPPLQAILPPLPGVRKRSAPVSRLEWESYRDFDGRISEENERKFRVRVFSGVSERGRVWTCDSPSTDTCRMCLRCIGSRVTHLYRMLSSSLLPPLPQGIAPELRRELWKYLLGYHRFGDTDLERMTERMARE